MVMASSAGYGFLTKAGDMVSRTRGGKSFVTLDAGDEPLAPRIVTASMSAIACLSQKGRLLVFGIEEIKTLSGGGRGVTLIALEDKEALLAVEPITQRGVLVRGVGRGGKDQEVLLSASGLTPHIGKRARKGKALESKIKATSLVAVVAK
jgi:topoisomerase-4 subunit A